MNRILYIIIAIILLCIISGIALFLSLASEIPRLPDDLSLLAYSPATEIYARNGDLLSTSGGREYVSLDRISIHFRNAIVAVEDKRFYRHFGVDHIATFRALLQNIISGGNAPGGSTITQQLAKNLFFSFHRSWKRKMLEVMAAMAIEDRFGKDEILETYCNLIPFGQYSYGVERASQVYFGKHASDLSIQEAALLAGLPNSPSRLNPFYHPDRAAARQKTILKRMASQRMIPSEMVDSLTSTLVRLTERKSRNERGSFPVDYALELANEAVGTDLVNFGGVRIFTGIDPYLQKIAQRAVTSGLDELEKRLIQQQDDNQSRLEGALVAIDVGTGQIVALVGSRDYTTSPYNRAVRSRRPPGSAFKPVTYLTAMVEGNVNPATIVNDTLVELNIDSKRTWEVNNFDNKYLGLMTLKLALMKSRNSIAAQLIDRVRPMKVVKTARALGVKSKLEPHLALSLGAQGVTPLEMTNIYSTLAREGIALEPYLVSRIEDRGGEILLEHLAAGESRFAPETVYQLLDMMKGVIDGGTGSIVRWKGFSGIAACKTGTSSDFRDSWFCGATPYLVVVVWVGYDDYREMRLKSGHGVTGASGAAPIWAEFMIKATAHEPIREFPRPVGIAHYYMEPIKGTLSIDPIEDFIPVALLIKDAEKIFAEDLQDTLSSTAD